MDTTRDELPPPVPESMRTEMRPIGSVKRYTRNPRKKQNIQKVAQSLKLYGWRQPIVVDKDGEIVVGDTRYLGAQELGFTHVPVWVAGDLASAQLHAYRIADNRIAEESDWDEAALAAELELLQQLGLATAQLEEATGFDPDELARYLGIEDAGAHRLEAMTVAEFPPFTWILIGISTNRFYEISDEIERIAAVPDAFCEVTANEDKP